MHGHDMISIRMIKLCSDSIYKPLEMIFNSCLNKGLFPVVRKKADALAVHRKGNRQCVNNCRPVLIYLQHLTKYGMGTYLEITL